MGRGRGASVSSGRGLFQSSHAATAPTPSVLPCRAGTPPSSRILRMDGSIPAGNVGYDDHRLARVRPVPALLLRPRRRTGDLFVRHIGGHVLRDDKQIHGGLPREDAEAGGVSFLEVAASPCVQRVGERGIRRQHAAEPACPLRKGEGTQARSRSRCPRASPFRRRKRCSCLRAARSWEPPATPKRGWRFRAARPAC